jgi:hypothetical protein
VEAAGRLSFRRMSAITCGAPERLPTSRLPRELD